MDYLFYEAPKKTTADRILETALKLFNEEGFHSVTANRIAKHMGMSAGHLAYHYKGKNDILQALLPRLERKLHELISIEFVHSIPHSIDRSLHVLRLMWEYRFFFTELPQLSALDRKIFQFYLLLEKHVVQLMRKSFEVRILDGTMRPIPQPNSVERLSRTVWTLWMDWVRHESLSYPGQELPSSESVYDAIMSAYCITQPFFPASFLDDVKLELDMRLKPGNAMNDVEKPARKSARTRARSA